MFSVAEDAINIQTDILLTSKSLLSFANWDSLSSYFAGEKVWRCSSFSSVSSLAWFVAVECRENVRSFRCLGKAFSFFMAARFVYFDFFYVAIEVAHIPTLILSFFFTKAKDEIRNLSCFKKLPMSSSSMMKSEVTSWSMKSSKWRCFFNGI